MTDLDKLADWFAEDAWPVIECPACRKGDLAPVAVTSIDTGASERARSHEAWDPEWIELDGGPVPSAPDLAGVELVVREST